MKDFITYDIYTFDVPPKTMYTSFPAELKLQLAVEKILSYVYCFALLLDKSISVSVLLISGYLLSLETTASVLMYPP